jgi:hypothetical protein
MKLYKFKSLNRFDQIEDIINRNRFYMANWRELNDPMEGHFTSIYDNDDVNYKTLLRNFIDYKISLRVCAFSKKINPILLWSHYADQHKGIAIEISFDENQFTNLHKVKYVNRIPEINLTPISTPLQVLTNKIRFWSYEREYRVIDNQDYITIGAITGIYFGVRASIWDKRRVRDLVEGRVKLFNTKINFESNNVEIKGLYSSD